MQVKGRREIPGSMPFVTRSFAVLAVGFSPLCAMTASSLITPLAGRTHVAGRLTHSGGPVARATLIFTPKDSKAGQIWGLGITNADGKFKVSEGTDTRGLRPGHYAVHLLPNSPNSPDGAVIADHLGRQIPERFYNFTTSDLSVEIDSGGSDYVDIELPEGPSA